MLDLTKPVQTRDGRKVRILCTDAQFQGGLGIVGLMDDGGFQNVRTWYADGKYSKRDVPDDDDLINAPLPKKKAKVFVELRQDVEGRDLYGVATINRPPHSTENIVLASTVVEMEYEEQP